MIGHRPHCPPAAAATRPSSVQPARPPAAAAALAVAIAMTSGCTSLLSLGAARFARTQPSPEAAEILAVWQPGEGRDTNGLPARGFAGRLFFFAPTSPSPVPVDGDVTVFLFDDQGTPDEQSRPIYRFHFDSAAWQTYRTESDVGTAYQLFLPYTREGDHHAICTLRVQFKSAGGRNTLSDAADVVLTGQRAEDVAAGDPAAGVAVRPTEVRGDNARRKSPSDTAVSMPRSTTDSTDQSPVRQAAFFDDNPGSTQSRPVTPRPSTLRTHTIPLGRNRTATSVR